MIQFPLTDLIRLNLNLHIYNNHLRLNDRAEEFILLGTELQKEVCPYCGLSFDETNDLIEAYKTYFDNVYNAFQQALLEKIEYIEAWDFREKSEKSRIG